MNAVPYTPSESVAILRSEVGKLTRLGVSYERATIEVARHFGLSPIAVRRLTWPSYQSVSPEPELAA